MPKHETVYKCGCVVWKFTGDETVLKFCKLHENAETLLYLVKAAESVVRQGGHLGEQWLKEAREVINA